MRASRTTRAAFTLIELLVVLAIIAVLASLALPGLGRMLESGRKAKSASNLRTLGGALMLYASDNNSAFPPCASTVKTPEGTWAAGGLGSWDSFILTYLFPEKAINPANAPGFYDIIKGRASLFSHPNDSSKTTTALSVRRGYAMPSGADMIGIATWSGTEVRPSARLSAIPSLSKTILLTELAGVENNIVGRTGMSGVSAPTGQTTYQANLNGQDGLFHYLFADGHVQLLKASETVGTGNLQTPKGFWTINPAD